MLIYELSIISPEKYSFSLIYSGELDHLSGFFVNLTEKEGKYF